MVNTTCPLCNVVEETLLHILQDCPFARKVWSLSPIQSVIAYDTALTFQDWFYNLSLILTEELLGLFTIICWNIWYGRNRWIWHNENSFGRSAGSKSNIIFCSLQAPTAETTVATTHLSNLDLPACELYQIERSSVPSSCRNQHEFRLCSPKQHRGCSFCFLCKPARHHPPDHGQITCTEACVGMGSDETSGERHN